MSESECIYPEEHRDSQGCLPFAYFRALKDKSCTPPVGTCFSMSWSDKPKPKKKEKEMSDLLLTPANLAASDTSAAQTATEIQPPSPQEISALVEQSGGGFAGVAAALIAVAGGGAAMKFYSDMNKNKHEEKMEKLRLESEAQKSNNGDHTACQAERATLLAKLEETNEKISRLESKQKGLALSVGDDMEDRLASLEKKVKRLSTE